MGLYAVLRGGAGSGLQLLATALKVPLLFLLTLVVTLPSLYVLSALARSRLSFTQTVRLLLAAVTVNMALLASFRPGDCLLLVVHRELPLHDPAQRRVLHGLRVGGMGLPAQGPRHRLRGGTRDERPNCGRSGSVRPNRLRITTLGAWGPRRPSLRRVDADLRVVGAQMGWILRPFIGAPNQPFQWFRDRQSNFFVVVWESFLRLF
jgi:hypothetical protein